jgi:medium-chain acyl-[acyl-carrier-protein] hydrolase
MRSIHHADRWIVAPRPSPAARLRLICFPHAGGSASSFRLWRSLVPPDIDVCPIQLPGRENRLGERPFSRLSSLVEALVDVLEPAPRQPYALFGHSMGALIAFELARALRARGTPPLHLLVAGHLPPQTPASTSPIHALPDQEFVNQLRRLNGTPPEVLDHPDLMRLIAPLLRADFSVCETYQYVDAAPLDCPISVFAGRADDGAPPDRMLGWRQHTTASCRFHTLASDHFFVSREAPAVVAGVVADLCDTLNEAWRAPDASSLLEGSRR